MPGEVMAGDPTLAVAFVLACCCLLVLFGVCVWMAFRLAIVIAAWLLQIEEENSR